jgi:hypothetical protein
MLPAYLQFTPFNVRILHKFETRVVLHRFRNLGVQLCGIDKSQRLPARTKEGTNLTGQVGLTTTGYTECTVSSPHNFAARPALYPSFFRLCPVSKVYEHARRFRSCFHSHIKVSMVRHIFSHFCFHLTD